MKKDGKVVKKAPAKKPGVKAAAGAKKPVSKKPTLATSKLQKGTARAKAAAILKAKRARLKVRIISIQVSCASVFYDEKLRWESL